MLLMLSPELVDHFQNPRNAGTLDSPDAVTVEVSNPACGDILRLSVLVKDGVIAQVRYKTRGCTAAIAAGSALTELMQSRTTSQLGELKAADVESAIGGLASASKHAAVLCEDGVRALVKALRMMA